MEIKEQEMLENITKVAFEQAQQNWQKCQLTCQLKSTKFLKKSAPKKGGKTFYGLIYVKLEIQEDLRTRRKIFEEIMADNFPKNKKRCHPDARTSEHPSRNKNKK